MIKPGWQTTQFWLTLGASIVAILVALGFVSPADKAGLEGAIARVVESLGGLLAAVAAIWRYTAFREQLYLAEADPTTVKGE